MSIQRSAPTIKATVQGLRALIATFPRPLSHHIATVHTLNHQDHDGVLKRVAIAPPMRPNFPYPITARKPFVSSHLHCQSILPMSRNSRTASHNRPPCTRPLCTTTSLIKGQQDLLKEGGFYENKPSLEVQVRSLFDEKNSEFVWLKEMKKAEVEMGNAKKKMEIAVESMEKAEMKLENAVMELEEAEYEMEKVEWRMKLERGKIEIEKAENEDKERNTLEKDWKNLMEEMEIVMEDYVKKLGTVNNY